MGSLFKTLICKVQKCLVGSGNGYYTFMK